MDKKATGFASPTQGYEEQNIDLNIILILSNSTRLKANNIRRWSRCVWTLFWL